MTVVTRFAPSPTGFLHIGGARTALFSYLYARRHGGAFRLRIEDTDRARSTQPAIDAILDGMAWLGLHWDGEVVYQFARAARHAEVAHELLEQGKAYKCYTPPEELAALREAATAKGEHFRFQSPWRDRDDGPQGAPYVIRIKAPREGAVTVRDHVQGEITTPADALDDMVLLRSDGTPVYMLAVVVDDHDMGVTHIIRGDDHLTNAARQSMIYHAMGWKVPDFAHVPMILGPDGTKLSKRHGAQGVGEYREMGYLPEAVRNYLLRLGWSHGDDEIISDAQAIQWFELSGVGKSPSRFDFTKLEHLNGHYIRESDDERLVELIAPRVKDVTGRFLDGPLRGRLLHGMKGLKARAKNINELADSAVFYAHSRPIPLGDPAKKLLTDEAKQHLAAFLPHVEALADWHEPLIEASAKAYAEQAGLKLGALAQPLRAALTGSNVSPGIFEVMDVLGREETLGRIGDAVTHY